MPLYRYQAVDRQGQLHSGTIQAPDVRTAQSQLQGRGLIVQQMMSVPDTASVSAPIVPPTPLPAQRSDTDTRNWETTALSPPTMVRLLAQLQVLVQAGYHLSEAFRIVSGRVQHSRLAQACRDVGERAARGEPISQAMARYPNLFPKFLIGNLVAGEQGGYLVETLSKLTEYYERLQSIQRYSYFPKGVMWLAVLSLPLAVGGMIGIVRSFGQTMENPTGNSLGIIAQEMGRGIIQYGIPLALLMVGVWFLLKWLVRTQGFGSWFRLNSPFVTGLSGWVKAHSIGLFLFHLERLSRTGLAPSTVWQYAVNTVPNYQMARALQQVRPTSERESLDGLLTRSGVIPPEEVAMVTTGLQTGTVDEILQRLHTYYQDQAQYENQRIPYGMARTGCLLMLILSGIGMAFIFWMWYRVLIPSIDQLFSP